MADCNNLTLEKSSELRIKGKNDEKGRRECSSIRKIDVSL